MKTALIPAQFFRMGSDDGSRDERPAHRVWVDSFEMGVTQVTNAEYASFVMATGSAAPASPFSDPGQPVVAVSWFDAVDYCEWLSEVSGRAVRLPYEAEWECAARGGAEGMRYPWGNELPPPDDARCADGPDPVARLAPNAYGLFDLCENVHEWCSDWYGTEYYAVSPERNPRGPDRGTRRSSRGGSWRHQIKVTCCSARSSIPPEYRYADYGFRVVCDVAMAGI